jgi:acyl-CoA synthetase (AMP-forming)/AMP-acid ligase II
MRLPPRVRRRTSCQTQRRGLAVLRQLRQHPWRGFPESSGGVQRGHELVDELIAFCSEHLSRQKVPRSIDFEDELPRLPTGKRLLRDRYWTDHQSRIV